MPVPGHCALILSLLCLSLVAGCGSGPRVVDGPPGARTVAPPSLPRDAVPREEPRSRYGNGPYYRVNVVGGQVSVRYELRRLRVWSWS